MIVFFRESFNRWIFFCFLFIGSLLAVRFFISGSLRFSFLVWNLFLAFIPYLVSRLLINPRLKKPWLRGMIFSGWLLFFPNALYIITDLIHLESNTNVPIWYDAILLFTASFAGLALGFASVVNVEYVMEKFLPKKYIPTVIVFLIFLGSFGVYLGRFERWNSWDIISDPFMLAKDIADRFISPFAHVRTWAVTFILTGLYTVCWFFLKSFPFSAIKIRDEDAG